MGVAKRSMAICCSALLGHKTRRAVVYRGPRLGALIGLAHELSKFMRLTFCESPVFREPRPTTLEWWGAHTSLGVQQWR